MKRTIISLFAILFSLSLYSQNSGLGVGVILGEPTGLSAKVWTSSKTAFDAAAAWSLLGEGYIHVHADALVHAYPFRVDSGKLPVYMGLGGRLLLADNPAIGVRIPFGIAYQFHSAPFDIFLEVAPILDILPATDFSYNSAIGIRYYL